jgi:hypothetical protein
MHGLPTETHIGVAQRGGEGFADGAIVSHIAMVFRNFTECFSNCLATSE